MSATHKHTVSFALVVALVALAGCGSTQNTGEATTLKPTPADIAGAWTSACVDPGNGQGFRLIFDLTETDWNLAYEAFADASCATSFLTVNIAGPYELGAASTAVEGAREGRFDFGTRTVTPHVDAAVGFLAQACGRDGFAVGTATDLAVTGCPGLGARPHADCPSDHDIVVLQGDTLSFGNRPADNDMCSPEKRPTAPGLPLTRR